MFLAPVVDDALSREIRDQADFAVVVPNSLQRAREVIAALELDILFYQDIGMDTLSYFLAFSRLAPAQCMGWGHPVTCGIPAMDFFISTEAFEPSGGEKHYNERLLKMANVATPSVYARPDHALASLSRTAAGFDRTGQDRHRGKNRCQTNGDARDCASGRSRVLDHFFRWFDSGRQPAQGDRGRRTLRHGTVAAPTH